MSFRHKHIEKQAIPARRENARALLKDLDLWALAKGTTLEERMLNAHYPRVEIGLAEGLPATPETDSMLRQLRKVVVITKFKCPRFEKPIPVIDYFSNVKPLADILFVARSEVPGMSAKIESAKSVNAELAAPETGADALMALWKACDGVLIKFGRIDTILYNISVSHYRASNGNYTVRMFLNSKMPRHATFQMPKGPRPAFQCGQPNGRLEIDWIEWDLGQLGLPGDNRNSPVYVQSHALDMLYKREARALFVDDGE